MIILWPKTTYFRYLGQTNALHVLVVVVVDDGVVVAVAGSVGSEKKIMSLRDPVIYVLAEFVS